MLAEKQSRHSIASIFCVVSMIGASATAHALSCAPRLFTLAEAYEAADSVVVGLVTECKEEISSGPWTTGGTDCSFVSLEVLKRSMPARDYSGTASSSGCGLSLRVGDQYLLFLDSANRPMHFSAPLSGDHYQVQKANQYLRILQDYRNGGVDDLAEPWMYGEYEGQCSVYHRFGGHQISISGRSPSARQRPAPEWNQETIDGEVVYKASVPMFDFRTKLPAGEAEIVAFGGFPDYNNDELTLKVTLQEWSPAPVRQATLSVGDSTWSLNRIETNLTLSGSTSHRSVEYYATGDTAEQILSEMSQPSDIVVSATVIASDLAATVSEVPSPMQPLIGAAQSNDNYFGETIPRSGSTRPMAAPEVKDVDSYMVHGKPPEPILRIVSRSTQLSSVIQSFRTCLAGEPQ